MYILSYFQKYIVLKFPSFLLLPIPISPSIFHLTQFNSRSLIPYFIVVPIQLFSYRFLWGETVALVRLTLYFTGCFKVFLLFCLYWYFCTIFSVVPYVSKLIYDSWQCITSNEPRNVRQIKLHRARALR